MSFSNDKRKNLNKDTYNCCKYNCLFCKNADQFLPEKIKRLNYRSQC